MVFSSPLFLFIFLPITLLAYWIAAENSNKHAKLTLFVSSLVFYGWWDMSFVPIILISITINFCLAWWLEVMKQKHVLMMGIIANLLLLAFFKYANFAVDTMNMLTNSDLGNLNIVLPLAISFFTFQQIAYIVDSYYGRLQVKGLGSYALFVLFFPQLIAGPIVHHKEMIPQYLKLKRFNEIGLEKITQGLILIVVGLFKKVVIADSLAKWVDPVFSSADTVSTLDAWTGVLAYTFQIYFDFSAYSEIAMGLALLFGIVLPLNFNSPYQSRSISEFWRTWHITLGRFLRDYLYIPLGGSKKGTFRTVVALSVTMLLGGLWHGAGWQFVFWGGLHAAFLSIAFIWTKKGFPLPKHVGVFLTFMAVMIAWVPFRAETINDAMLIWQAMFDWSHFSLQPVQAAILSDIAGRHIPGVLGFFKGWEMGVLILIAIAVLKYPNIHYYIEHFKPNLKNYAVFSGIAIFAIAIMGRPQTFIYFNF